MIPHISIQDIASLYNQDPHNITIIDVREIHEHDIAHIKHATHIPLGTLAQQYQTLPKEGAIYCLCHFGGRSFKAAEFLIQQGYNAINIEGGIDAWACDIDPTMTRY